jgi:hypothetical protein
MDPRERHQGSGPQFHESRSSSPPPITKLQPRFPRVWAFHAWNLAYNISVETQTPEERYQWVLSGVRLLRDEAIPANPTDIMLHKELAWIMLHKIGGYTDDANRFYKREWAAEWTVVVGVPPTPEPDARERDAVIALYADWLQPIADAPARLETLAERVPAVEGLVADLRSRAGLEPDIELLRRWTQHQAVRALGAPGDVRGRVRENNLAFAALLDDPAYASAWEALVPFVRRSVLVGDFNMEPRRMIRYTREVRAHGLAPPREPRRLLGDPGHRANRSPGSTSTTARTTTSSTPTAWSCRRSSRSTARAISTSTT